MGQFSLKSRFTHTVATTTTTIIDYFPLATYTIKRKRTENLERADEEEEEEREKDLALNRDGHTALKGDYMASISFLPPPVPVLTWSLNPSTHLKTNTALLYACLEFSKGLYRIALKPPG